MPKVFCSVLEFTHEPVPCWNRADVYVGGIPFCSEHAACVPQEQLEAALTAYRPEFINS